MSRPLIAMLLIASVVGLVYLWLGDRAPQDLASTEKPSGDLVWSLDTPPLQAERTETVEHIAALLDTDALQQQVPEDFFESLPASLSDVPRPVDLGIDENGDLIIDQRIRSLFEFYLMGMGEEALQDIVLRIQHELRSQLDPAAYAQANTLLEGYLQYRNNIGVINNQYAGQIAAEGASLDGIIEAKRAVRESRTDFLGEDASVAFFAAEDEYDDYMMGRARVLTDASLTQEEKRQQLELLDLNSPEDLVSARRQSRILSEVGAQVSQLRSNGATDNEIYSYREQQLGVEVAARLAALDTERQAWQARVDAYRTELAGLESAQEYPVEERQRMIEALREQHFEERELLRIRALDKNRNSTSN